ncbi:hypothetical protein [Fodinicola feengrottensis]|uniref:Cbb3-type cytochrome oxidase assembly protein CcoS n=1 Tax=Fodinicola feengrottensis TaxID=435914 RepID=A0ABP4U3S9_9ACTN|nr:hypothetical protein [Fodinicola feengrottensis]
MFWIALMVAAGLFAVLALVWTYLDGARRFDRTIAQTPDRQENVGKTSASAASRRHRRGA